MSDFSSSSVKYEPPRRQIGGEETEWWYDPRTKTKRPMTENEFNTARDQLVSELTDVADANYIDFTPADTLRARPTALTPAEHQELYNNPLDASTGEPFVSDPNAWWNNAPQISDETFGNGTTYRITGNTNSHGMFSRDMNGDIVLKNPSSRTVPSDEPFGFGQSYRIPEGEADALTNYEANLNDFVRNYYRDGANVRMPTDDVELRGIPEDLQGLIDNPYAVAPEGRVNDLIGEMNRNQVEDLEALLENKNIPSQKKLFIFTCINVFLF
jgi:hypothetical protein